MRKLYPRAVGILGMAWLLLPAMAQASERRAWIVYFSDQTSSFSDENLAVIHNAADYQQMSCPSESLTVIAGTDTLGGSDDNMRRSQDYATAVADKLVAEGVPRALVRMTALGESQQVVATGDNVAEALNRWAEIKIGEDDQWGVCDQDGNWSGKPASVAG